MLYKVLEVEGSGLFFKFLVLYVVVYLLNALWGVLYRWTCFTGKYDIILK